VDAKIYYACIVRLNGDKVFVAWSPGEPDSFLRDTAGRLLVARSPEALAAATRTRGVTPVGGDPADYDFDRIRGWCATPEAAGVDCPAFLNAWNFFDDLAGLHSGADTRYTRLSRRAAGCYDKLFWGNNLPAVATTDERYIPSWESAELGRIRRVMRAGIELMEAELSSANSLV
jgi:hypothetical protein